jgi:hypothetical protein
MWCLTFWQLNLFKIWKIKYVLKIKYVINDIIIDLFYIFEIFWIWWVVKFVSKNGKHYIFADVDSSIKNQNIICLPPLDGSFFPKIFPLSPNIWCLPFWHQFWPLILFKIWKIKYVLKIHYVINHIIIDFFYVFLYF